MEVPALILQNVVYLHKRQLRLWLSCKQCISKSTQNACLSYGALDMIYFIYSTAQKCDFTARPFPEPDADFLNLEFAQLGRLLVVVGTGEPKRGRI